MSTQKLVHFTAEKCFEISVADVGIGATTHSAATSIIATEQHYSTVNISPVRIGHSPSDHIMLESISTEFTIQNGYIHAIDATALYLNGKKISAGKHAVALGDSIWIGTEEVAETGTSKAKNAKTNPSQTLLNITIRQNYLTLFGINYTSTLNISTFTPEKYNEYPIYKRSPRIIKRRPVNAIELTAPEKKEEINKGGLFKTILPPLAMIAVTVTMGILLGRGLFMLMSASMMTITIIVSVSTFFSDRKKRKEKERKRIENYEKYLLAKHKEIHATHKTFEESLRYHNLSPAEIEKEILSYSSRLYERASGDSDFLTLSLGYSTLPVSYTVKYVTEMIETDEDPLTEEMQALGDLYQAAEHMPTVIDLKQAHLGIVGEKPYIHRQLTSMLIQLCFYQSYHDIEIILLAEDEDFSKFEWVRWLPHCRNKNINITGLVTAEGHRDQVLGNIAQVLKTRKLKQDEEKKDSKYLPHYVFIIDNPKLIINHSVMEYLQVPDTTLGFSLIYTTYIRANLPENIRTVFMLDGGDRGTLLMDSGELLNRDVILYDISEINTEVTARKLAPIKHTQGVSTQIPENVTFFELYNAERPEDIPVLDLWERNACHKSLSVPLGLRAKDDIVTLNLHEKAHGPHGLVAGTTGSGKSEILQSYILSLAVNFHPHEVGFLLIDYKGGGMANLFANLPHLLGTITNLDGSESMRALVSIKSELARRQRIFGDAGVNSINQYTKMFKAGEVTLPMPHLFIISDEFAELKKEQPDFMTELVSTARIGRSLGVHLILATQKPTGVVDDQIWSNSRFKLALKVADESDSNEILKTPDAARLTQPGRAYLQVGNNEVYELFQSAYSGAPFSEEIVRTGFDGRVYLINSLGQGELLNEDLSAVDVGQESNLTQLDVMVNHINELHKSLNATTIDRPWLPPLDTKLVTPHITSDIDVGLIEAHNLNIAIGMVDIPEEQTQTEYIHHFAEDGNLAFFGASGFGKSTSLMNVALQLSAQNSPQLLNHFILDYGNSALAQLRDLPHTADYLTIDDSDKLDKLIKFLTDELKKRKSLFAKVGAINFRMYNEVAEAKMPAICVFIDNYDVVKEIAPELEEFFVKLTRDGTGVGIYTIVSASRSNAMRYAVLNNFKNKIAHFMFDHTDTTMIVGRSAYKLPDIQGRILVKMKDVHIAQCYLPVPHVSDIEYTKNIAAVVTGIAKNNTAGEAKGVRIVPEVVVYDDLVPYLNTNAKQAVIGFDTESTEPVYFDISGGNNLILGGISAGKTNLLKLVAIQFASNSGNANDSKLFIADSHTGELSGLSGLQNVTYMEKENQFEAFFEALVTEVESRANLQQSSAMRLREFCTTQPPTIVLIDDADNFIGMSISKARELESLIPKAMELGIGFVVTSRLSRLRGFDTLTKIFRDTQTSLIFGNVQDQNIYQLQPPRGYKPAQDIGLWYMRGNISSVKLPLISDDDMGIQQLT